MSIPDIKPYVIRSIHETEEDIKFSYSILAYCPMSIPDIKPYVIRSILETEEHIKFS